MSWQRKKLGDIADLIVGFAFKSQHFLDASECGVRLVRGDNVQQGFLRWGDKAKKWNSSDYEDFRRYQLEKDDVLLAMDRPIVGGGLKLAWVKELDLPCLLVQRVTRIRGAENLARTNFLRYVLSTPAFLGHIESVTTGANIPHISGKDIASFELRLPPLAEQDRIVETLSAYDDLVEANLRRIELLEESARLLYREWFINFRFPGYETAHKTPSELGHIPHGWKIVSLKNVCSRVTDGAHKSPPTVEDGRPMASVKDMRDFDIDVAKCRKISEKSYDELVKADCKVVKGDILVAKDGSYLKHIFECGESEEIVLLSSIAMLRPNTEILGCFLMYALKSPDVNFRMRQCVSGVAIPRIVLKDFRNFKILLPPLQIQQEWVDIAGPMVQLCRELVRQNDALKSSRDFLLPQLMSGAIQV